MEKLKRRTHVSVYRLSPVSCSECDRGCYCFYFGSRPRRRATVHIAWSGCMNALRSEDDDTHGHFFTAIHDSSLKDTPSLIPISVRRRQRLECPTLQLYRAVVDALTSDLLSEQHRAGGRWAPEISTRYRREVTFCSPVSSQMAAFPAFRDPEVLAHVVHAHPKQCTVANVFQSGSCTRRFHVYQAARGGVKPSPEISVSERLRIPHTQTSL